MATAGPVPQKNEGRVFYEPAVDRSAPSDAFKKRLQKEAKELYGYDDDQKYNLRATSEDEIAKQLKTFESKSNKQKEAFWGKSTTPGSFTLLRKADAKKTEEGYMDGYRYLLEEDKKEYEELKEELERSIADPNIAPDARQKFTELVASVNERLSLTAERLAVLTKAENKEDLSADETSTLARTLEETGTEIAKTQLISSGNVRGIGPTPIPRETGAMKLKKVGGEVFSSLQKIRQAQKEAEEATKRTNLMQEILNLSFEVDADLIQARSLEEKIVEKTVKAALKAETSKLESSFMTLRKNPTVDSRDTFKVALEEFKKLIEQTNDFIRNNPKPTTPVSTPAPAAMPAISAEPLLEYGGWPSDVYYKKQSKGAQGGWYAREGTQENFLTDQEQWENENRAFKIVYEHYSAFIKSLKLADRQLAKPLIDARARVIEAIKERDVMRVAATREEFEAALEDWQKRWENLGKIKSCDKTFGEVKKVAEKVLANIDTRTEAENIRAKQSEIDDQLTKAREAILRGEAVDFERISGMLDAYKKIIDSYEITQNALSIQTKMGRAVLRPIQSTAANKNQQIRTSGGNHSNILENDHLGLTVEEYEAILKNKQEAEKRTALTKQTLADWPELRAEGYGEGDEIEKKSLEKLQTKIAFSRMLDRGENSFLSLYVTPSVDPVTQEVRYAATENLRKHPQKEIIKEILNEKKGIIIFDQTRQQRVVGETISKEKEMFRRTALGKTYNPTRDMENGLIFKTTDKKTHISSEGGMVINEKRRPITMAEGLGDGTKQWPILDRELSPEDEARKQASLKKVNDITEAMQNWFTKDLERRGQKKQALWSVLGAGVLGATLAIGMGHKEQVEQLQPHTAAVAPEIGAEKLRDWKEGFADKQFIEDIKKMTADQLVTKYSPLAADGSKPSTISDVLAMDGNKLLKDPERCYGLDDDKRGQLCKFLSKIEELSRAVDAPVRDRLAREGLYDDQSDWRFAPNITIQQGIEMIQAKIARADK